MLALVIGVTAVTAVVTGALCVANILPDGLMRRLMQLLQ